jgi:hypothetical protein
MNYSYGNTLTIKSKPSEFEFHGKPNEPNVIFTNGKQYISNKIYIYKPSITGYDGELRIEHTLTTNYDEPLILYFPLKTDPSFKPNIIDRMISSNPGDSLEVNLNTVLPQNGDFEYKGKNIAVLKTPIIIKTRIVNEEEPIIEGACVKGSPEEAIAKLQTDMNSLKGLLDEHAKSGYSLHHGNTGGTGGGVSENDLKNILKDSGIKCTPFEVGKEKKSLRLLDIDPRNKDSKIDIANPIAYTFAFIIISCVIYFGLTSVYKRILQSLLYKFNNEARPTLERIHIYEGIVGFVLLLLFTVFVVPSSFNSPVASGIFILILLVYSITLGISRKSIIVDVMGSTYEIDDLIRTTIRSIPFNLFWFYPFFIYYAGMYAIKMYKG